MATKGEPGLDAAEAVEAALGRVEAAAVEQLDELDARAKSPALYEAALKVARTMDATTAARDLAALAREFRTLIGELERIATEGPQEVSAVDEIAARRAERLAAAAEVAGASGA